MRHTIGIDPGVHGAMALMGLDRSLLQVCDLPIMDAPLKGQHMVDGGKLCALLAMWATDRRPVDIYLENVHAMPKQGTRSTFTFGRAVGAIETACAAMGMPVMYVTPQKWKKHLNLIKNPEESDAVYAFRVAEFTRKLYPAAPIKLAKHHNRIDAILIARYGQEPTA